MSRTHVNTRLIAERRAALNMSQRALIQAAAVSSRLIFAVDSDSDGQISAPAGASMTLADLWRLATALAVTPAELLTPDDSTRAGPPADDVAVLLAALMDGARAPLSRKDDIAQALGWSLERVDGAASQAAEHLPALGLMLHNNTALGLGVRTKHGVLSPQAQQRLARAKTIRTNLRLDHARVLRDVAHGKFGKDWRWRLRSHQRACIQALRKRGLVEDTQEGLRLTATASYSLLLSDEPPANDASPPDPMPDLRVGQTTDGPP